jgi:hypothetical protein
MHKNIRKVGEYIVVPTHFKNREIISELQRDDSLEQIHKHLFTVKTVQLPSVCKSEPLPDNPVENHEPECGQCLIDLLDMQDSV